jgi:hypothetical protein
MADARDVPAVAARALLDDRHTGTAACYVPRRRLGPVR